MKIRDTLLQDKKNYIISDILIGLAFTLFLISTGVLIAIYFKPLYYLDIKVLNIDKNTGLPKDEIKQNYNTLIQYCSPFYKGDLNFPTLHSSKTGLSHFKEVKTIFNITHLIALLSCIICIVSFYYKKHRGHYRHLLIAPITAILLPLIVGIATMINFNAVFNFMHKILFRNNDWIFDPETDPIINLLPEKYFMHCALLIIFVVLIGCIISLIFYFQQKKKYKVDELVPMKKNYYY